LNTLIAIHPAISLALPKNTISNTAETIFPTLITEKDYCETFKFNWAEWYMRRRELYDRGNEEPMFGGH